MVRRSVRIGAGAPHGPVHKTILDGMTVTVRDRDTAFCCTAVDSSLKVSVKYLCMSVKFIENTLRGKQKIGSAQPDAGWGLFRRAGWTPARVRMADHKGVKVFVGNLPPEAESRDLRDFFKVLLLLMYANNLRNDGSF